MNTPDLKKISKNYKNICKYAIVTISGKYYLILSVKDTTSDLIYYVTNEDLFDILNTCHTSIGQDCQDRMVSKLKQNYCNIIKEAIMMYLRLCIHSEKKLSNKKRRLVSKPIKHLIHVRRWICSKFIGCSHGCSRWLAQIISGNTFKNEKIIKNVIYTILVTENGFFSTDTHEQK